MLFAMSVLGLKFLRRIADATDYSVCLSEPADEREPLAGSWNETESDAAAPLSVSFWEMSSEGTTPFVMTKMPPFVIPKCVTAWPADNSRSKSLMSDWQSSEIQNARVRPINTPFEMILIMATTIQVGDEVQLTSDGPKMKVAAVSGETAHCIWVHGSKRCEDDFPVASLTKVVKRVSGGLRVTRLKGGRGGL
jgi:uncharacterized protein YodC (DUF2158 family)